MNKLSFTIRLLKSADDPADAVSLNLQALVSGATKWKTVDCQKTNAEGQAKFVPKWSPNMDRNAILGWRVTDASSEDRDIVTMGGFSKSHTRRGKTKVDFGEVQLVNFPIKLEHQTSSDNAISLIALPTGHTAVIEPALFDVDHNRIRVGTGGHVFEVGATDIAGQNPPNITAESVVANTDFTLQQKVSIEVARRTEALFLEKQSLASQLTIARNDIQLANDTRDAMKINFETAVRREATANSQVSKLTEINFALEQDKTKLDKALFDTNATLQGTLAEMKTVQDNLIKMQDEHQATQVKLSTAQAQVTELTKQVELKSPIRNLMANIGSELHAVNANQTTGGRPVKIGNIKVKMSGHLADNGASIIMNAASGALTAGHNELSTIESEISIEGNESTHVSDVKVPDLVGLTEGAAKRVLTSIGLKANVAYRTMKGRTGSNGQIINHSPKAGDTIEVNGTVFLIIKRTSGT